ncbi:extracellular calcium-sensing receptor-like [Xenopus tropicalis]|uniref:Extracellular calcium-sensing receptor-like n=1 Tax=Xenopus tropicalis TaxID=8364 RepID=A0A8J1JAW8_XENTR|nr:extracellular calcium-sensing receptor-like [Xenopus tropicalis]
MGEDTDYGQEGIRTTTTEILRSGACVAFTGYILTSRPDRNAPYLSRVIIESNVSVIVVFSSGSNFVPVVEELLKHNVTGKTWVASESWSTSALVSKEKYWRVLKGTIGFALHSGHISGLKQFMNSLDPKKTPDDIFLKEFWEVNFRCKWQIQEVGWTNSTNVCTGQESNGPLFTDGIQRVTYSVYIAVYALAWALHGILMSRQRACLQIHKTCNESLSFQPWQVMDSMRTVHFEAEDGRNVYFDPNGNLPAVYDIVNWQMDPAGNIHHVKVGNYDGSTEDENTFSVNTSSIQWNTEGSQVPLSFCSRSCPIGFRKAAILGKPICCFQCVPCPSGEISNQTDSVDCFRCPWDQWPNNQKDQCILKPVEFLSCDDPVGVTLITSSVISSIIPVALLGLFINFKTTPIVRANNYLLSCVLLVSLSLCFLCSLGFIGYPQPEKCLLRQVAFGMVFALCISCVLAKTITVVIAFKATKPGSKLRKWTGTKVTYLVTGLGVLLQLGICIIWLSTFPSFPENDIQTQPGVIIAHCNEGFPTAFWCMLGYLGLLATISFVLAFLVRRLPDSFNEAKYITFSMLAFLSVWVSFIPAYLSARGKYTDAMEVFAILSSTWALVICIFLPKCFIIIFQPELNNKDSLMGRGKK